MRSEQSEQRRGPFPPLAAAGAEREGAIPRPDGSGALAGDLAVPDGAAGLVVFAHGSGSRRHSRRNRSVASGLRRQRFATLLLDLLSPEEEAEDRDGGRQAYDRLRGGRRLQVVAGATHLFEEPGALEQVTSLAAGWFAAHLTGGSP